MSGFSVKIKHPPTAVGMNGRAHWARRYKITAEIKKSVLWLMESQRVDRALKPNRYDINWRYKMGKMPDDDNVISRCKSIRDAVAEFLGMDDQLIRIGKVRIKRDLEDAGMVELTFYYSEEGDD